MRGLRFPQEKPQGREGGDHSDAASTAFAGPGFGRYLRNAAEFTVCDHRDNHFLRHIVARANLYVISKVMSTTSRRRHFAMDKLIWLAIQRDGLLAHLQQLSVVD